jgi:hypothetical protein
VSRRHTLFFIGFLSLLICTTIIVIIALVHTTTSDRQGISSDEMMRLGGIVHVQGQQNLALREELVELKRELNALKASGAGLKTSLSSVKPSHADGELVARMQDVEREYGFRDRRIAQTLFDPSRTADDKVTVLQMSLFQEIDAEIEEQAARINELQRRADRGAVPSLDVETMKLKRLIDRRSQMFDMLRQIIDKSNETAHGIIDSMGR